MFKIKLTWCTHWCRCELSHWQLYVTETFYSGVGTRTAESPQRCSI